MNISLSSHKALDNSEPCSLKNTNNMLAPEPVIRLPKQQFKGISSIHQTDSIVRDLDRSSKSDLQHLTVTPPAFTSAQGSSTVNWSQTQLSVKAFDPYEPRELRGQKVREKFKTRIDQNVDTRSIGSQLRHENEQRRKANPLLGLTDKDLLFRDH